MTPVTAITGASRGLGRAFALRLARDGHRIAVGYHHDADAAADVVDELARSGADAAALRVDVTDASSLEAFLAAAAHELGPVTGVVANAGAVRSVGPLVEHSPDDLRRDLEVNLLGPVLTARAAVPHLAATGGSLVLVGSGVARLGGAGRYVHYAAAKAGVAALATGLSKELAPLGIRVNCVEPGTIHTGFHPEPDRADVVGSTVPLGRSGQPEDVAGAVAYLLGAESSYTTGAVIRVSGGL